MLGVPNGHPLGRRKAVRFAEALAHPFVGPHADSTLAVLMASAAKACGRPMTQRVQVSSFDAMCRLVETRLGITVLPEGVLAPHVAAGRLKSVALKEPWAERELVVVVRDLDHVAYLTQTLIDHLRPRDSTTP
jgi:DNA-binding transcriptional LysR family regulator